MFTIDTLIDDRLYTEKIIMHEAGLNCLFIHGGPGLNSFKLRQYIQLSEVYRRSEVNFIFYDQFGCGQSKKSTKNLYSHSQNVDDLHKVLSHYRSEIDVIIAHSYGAKLLYDYITKIDGLSSTRKIFLATSRDILTPRLNNLQLDLRYLEDTDNVLYRESIEVLGRGSECPISKINEITKKFNKYFLSNPHRAYFYWFNQTAMAKYNQIEDKYPMNQSVFSQVREDLYKDPSSFDVNWEKADKAKLFIGYHDRIMNGHHELVSDKVSVFYHSGHYPHIEEPERFIREVCSYDV